MLKLLEQMDGVDWAEFNEHLEHLAMVMTEFVRELTRGQEDDPEVQKILRELEEDHD